jgi:hypothetical protein
MKSVECSCNKKPFFPAKVRVTINGFERIITFKPGFVCEKWLVNPEDGSNHGIASPDILFLLRNDRGAIQFLLMTGWYLNGTTRKPMPYDLGYHSPSPMYQEQRMADKECPWLDNKPCYYDGSSLNAEKPFRILIEEGEEALWEYLENYHKEIFSS